MNEQLRLLIDLQKIDSTILSTRLKMDAIPAAIASHEGPLKNAESACESVRQNNSDLEKKKRDKEREIEDLKERINKLKQRTSGIKNNKEYQAHTNEIEKAEKELKRTEDELLSIMDSIEGASKVLEIEQGRIAEEKAKIETIKKEFEKEVGKGAEEIKRIKGERKKLVEKINGDLYNDYMAVLKTSRGVAVVEAKDEACHGCNMHIPPQLFVEIKSSDEIIHCLQCRRILYYVKPEEAK
ncbi:MAG: hypothetical protein HY957_04765 [Nitrospirae bacterium]|nr:hypothetical protein [Nitrospirota bacterium]